MENNWRYQEQSISTMTPGELVLLLFDELVKRLLRADLALAKKDYEVFEASVDRASAILEYLDDTLDRRYPISANLHKLYDYFTYELTRVKYGRNKTELDRIRPMITELRDTFRIAEKHAADEKHHVTLPQVPETAGEA